MRKALLAIALTALAAAFPFPARAQSPALEGSYTLVAETAGEISRAIEAAIRPMNFLIRPVARGRLRKTNVPYARLRLTVAPAEITTIADRGNPVVTPSNGTIVKWRREDGETFDVSTSWQGEKLHQTFRAEDGQRENVYSIEADGTTLNLAVTLSSPRLAAPVKYTLRYRRE